MKEHTEFVFPLIIIIIIIIIIVIIIIIFIIKEDCPPRSEGTHMPMMEVLVIFLQTCYHAISFYSHELLL